MEQHDKRILILGVGNILYTDEGFGVRVAEELEQRYEFSPNVETLDGGTLGFKLMGPIMESDHLIIVDIVLNDGKPGDVFRLKGEDLSKSLAFKNSMHQTDLLDVLAHCKLIGQVPDTVVLLGVEPKDYETMSTELSGELTDKLPDVLDAVLKEITAAGGTYTPRTADNPSPEKVYVPRSTS